ncbi:hypothetical protein ACHAWF_007848 [Thalassiosira exigua]
MVAIRRTISLWPALALSLGASPRRHAAGFASPARRRARRPLPSATPLLPPPSPPIASPMMASPLNDFFGNFLGNGGSDDEEDGGGDERSSDESSDDVDDDASPSSFQRELRRRREEAGRNSAAEGGGEEEEEKEEDAFDGYGLRDAIVAKYGECFDVDFQRVDSYGFRSVYLNILPFRLGGRRFRHRTEYDYLCHLQAVVEILAKYDQLDYVLFQLSETKKKPRAGTSPLVAVPLRLDLTPEQVDKILG